MFITKGNLNLEFKIWVDSFVFFVTLTGDGPQIWQARPLSPQSFWRRGKTPCRNIRWIRHLLGFHKFMIEVLQWQKYFWKYFNIKYNCAVLFLRQFMYSLFMYASKYYPIDHHCKTSIRNLWNPPNYLNFWMFLQCVSVVT